MKAYIIKMTIEVIEPMIQRGIIFQAGATINRLHDITQHVTNFQSYWIDQPYHFFVIDVEDMPVMNNPVVHQIYKKETFKMV